MILKQLEQHWTMCKLINSNMPSQRVTAKLYFQAQAGLRGLSRVHRKAVCYATRRIS